MPSNTFASWIGTSKEEADVVTIRLASSLAATLNAEQVIFKKGDAAPLGIHWCLCPTISRTVDLKDDGHPRNAEFLPPIPLPHRMFAATEAEFILPILVGDDVRRVSTIVEITPKEGRSGPLCFVKVQHEYSTSRGVALREIQDIVFRDAGSAATKPDAISASAIPAGTIDKRTMIFGETMLFRYSALTFNSHRVHLDRQYAAQSEKLGGLIVHSPLLATCLISFAASIKSSWALSYFAFRSTRPLNELEAVTFYANEKPNGLLLQAVGENAGTCMTATAMWMPVK